MTEDRTPGPLDRAVELVAKAMNLIGLNGTRLLWKWNRRRAHLGEAGMRTEVMLRSARGKHKMCPECRALVERSATTCSECGTSLAKVSTPGVGRLVTNLLPGVTAATSLLMLVNGFWFVMCIMAQMKAGSGQGLSPFGGFDPELMVRFGSGLSRPAQLSNGQIVGGEWWRLITPMFLHGGLLHFFFNTYLLLYLGPIVEEIYGTTRFWVIYLLCGIAGCMASQIPRPVNTIGASGAIMGLIGLLLVYGMRRGDMLGQSMKNLLWRLIIYSVILNIVSVFRIDHLNHLGGFACGALLALLVPRGEFANRGEARFWQGASLAGVLLVVLAFYMVAAQGRLAVGT